MARERPVKVHFMDSSDVRYSESFLGIKDSPDHLCYVIEVPGLSSECEPEIIVHKQEGGHRIIEGVLKYEPVEKNEKYQHVTKRLYTEKFKIEMKIPQDMNPQYPEYSIRNGLLTVNFYPTKPSLPTKPSQPTIPLASVPPSGEQTPEDEDADQKKK